MNAETLKAEDLSLPQAFLLLATNDKNGNPEVPVYVLRTTLAGAILAELDLIGAIELQGKHVRATGTTPQTDFQHELEIIRHKSRPHTPKRWVSMLEGRAEAQRVYEGMVSLGIVEQAGEKHLGLFRTVRYPEKDHAPEAALLKKIQAALSSAAASEAGTPGPATPGAGASEAGTPGPATPGAAASEAGTPGPATPGAVAPEDGTRAAVAPEAGAPDAAAPDAGTPGTPGPAKPAAKGPDARTMALIALLQAAGLLGKLFPQTDKIWASELAKDHWPSRAVEDELLMIRLAEEEAPAL